MQFMLTEINLHQAQQALLVVPPDDAEAKSIQR